MHDNPPQRTNLSPTDRLVALMDHLGLGSAYFGTPIPRDISGLATAHPERLAGIVLCVPSRLDPAPFSGIADRVLMIAGERGPAAEATARAAARLPAAQRSVLAGYDAPGSWSDAVADRTDEIADRMIAFLDRLAANGKRPDGPGPTTAEGRHAGISYRIEGSGPALMLLPFFLAPSQWAPAIPRLARHFTVVTLGGPHLGGVASLEDRARMPTYQAMFRTLIDQIGPRPGEAILEIGCGAGSLVRLLAGRLGNANPITAADVNPFLLREAAQLAEAEGLGELVRFTDGNAEALPFEDQFVRLRLFGHRVRGMRCGSGDRRGDARHPPRWADWSGRARARHAAMVEPRLARGDPAQSDNAAAFGRSARRCRPQPLPDECARPVWSISSAFRQW